MTRETIREPRNRLLLIVLGTFVLLAFMAGFLVDAPQSEVPPVLAATACSTANPTCVPTGVYQDLTKTSGITVTHKDIGSTSLWVEPNDGESWEVIAHWNTSSAVECAEYTETAEVEVYWDGSDWQTQNVVTTTNIIDIQVCDVYPDPRECQSGEDVHSWAYLLIADIHDPLDISGSQYNLRMVTYELQSVDDGRRILSPGTTCTLGGTVSWAENTDGGVDHGPFELSWDRCRYVCEIDEPAHTTIYYE
jgi:hypothetical protein